MITHTHTHTHTLTITRNNTGISFRVLNRYEMGVAHVTLLNSTVQGLVNSVWTYLEEQVCTLCECA